VVRIVAGRFRGRRLQVPAGLEVRPTGDRVKVALFDTLQAEVRGGRVVDLYAGSGALGLEALSRGARHVVLVERAAAALEALESNIALLGVASEVEVVRGDALRYLGQPHAAPFDLVLADPPYADGQEAALVAAVPGALRSGGSFVLQHTRRWPAPPRPPGLLMWRTRRFGDTVVDFYCREEDALGDEGAHGALPGHV
jgi:16S rRNA (guanine966-N2)-methyltransferase